MCSLTHSFKTHTHIHTPSITCHTHMCTHTRTHTDVRHMVTYLQGISLSPHKHKSDQILPSFSISHIHNASMTQCLYSGSQTKRGEVWNAHVEVGAAGFCFHRRWLPVFAAEVNFYSKSSAVAEELCSESVFHKHGCLQSLDMSFKERQSMA